MIHCTLCETHVEDCTCDDIDARLQPLSKRDEFDEQFCVTCSSHESRCACS